MGFTEGCMNGRHSDVWAAWLYLVVSSVSLTIQTTALVRIMRHSATLARNGLRRTAVCRVSASVAYVSLGVAAILEIPATDMAAFGVLLAVQCLWQVNALLDSRLAHRLNR